MSYSRVFTDREKEWIKLGTNYFVGSIGAYPGMGLSDYLEDLHLEFNLDTKPVMVNGSWDVAFEVHDAINNPMKIKRIKGIMPDGRTLYFNEKEFSTEPLEVDMTAHDFKHFAVTLLSGKHSRMLQFRDAAIKTLEDALATFSEWSYEDRAEAAPYLYSLVVDDVIDQINFDSCDSGANSDTILFREFLRRLNHPKGTNFENIHFEDKRGWKRLGK
ncbi:MAG: hypothetical protein CL489_10535 [Acidobacteria bacterium]|nr:hypothetical protein [Acidobacteriota bacterium]|tara:strand:- start:3067 stop:3714 length:648 start_codon:yes stop_codon:yes gene_type:complete